MSEPTLCGAGLRVRFLKRGDRYGHVVEVQAHDQFVPLLESLEGTPEENWPASPPLQSLHIEERGGGRSVALLVGMAGGSHWSMSVELDPTAGHLTWDVACRVRQPAAFVGSSYRVAAGVAVDADGDTLHLAHGGSRRSLRLQSIEHELPPRLVQEADRLVVAATPRASDAKQTVRWCYRLG